MRAIVSGRSLTLRFLGVHPRGVGLERLLALVERLLDRLPSVRVERVTLPDLGEPVAQLDQVDLVLLEFGVGEVVRGVLVFDLLEEVLRALRTALSPASISREREPRRMVGDRLGMGARPTWL